MKNFFRTFKLKPLQRNFYLLAGLLCISLPAAHADDIEALVSAPKEANILFVLDVSGSMGWYGRLDQMKQAIDTLIDSQTNNPNIGFTYFGGPNGSGIKWPVAAIDSDAHDLDPKIPQGTTNGQVIKYMANALTAGGWTPTTDALLEAALYFRGERPFAGSQDVFGTWDTSANPPQYTRGTTNSNPQRKDGRRAANPITLDDGKPKKYKSPIQECQANAIVLLSDGAPTKNTANGQVRTLIAQATGQNSYSCESTSGLPSNGRCAPDLARFLFENDQVQGVPNSNVRTYTIGFHLDRDSRATRFLRKVADYGGGEAYSANNANSLVTAIDEILADVARQSRTFTGISTSVQRNTLKTSNKSFLPMFQPSQHAAWEGNIKGYFLNNGVLVDLTGEAAIDTADSGTGFKTTARSFWTTAPDGGDLLLGGLRGRLDPDNRKIYVITDPDPDKNSDVDLADGSHNLKTSNSAFSRSNRRNAAKLLGLPAGASYSDVEQTISWLRSARMGDPLHAPPVMIDYGGNTGEILFVATNQGYLHAFDVNAPDALNDTTGGEELFAFMPYEHLSKQARARSNPISDDHVYGNDGELRFWVRDLDGNGQINGNDKVYLFFGMRRGGSAYYGMDVTDPNSPKVMWRIKAGDTGFSKLGQSWSAPAIVNVKDSTNDTRTVLIFGGGYDTAHDLRDQSRNSDGDGSGVGIYIVDPITGARLNSIGTGDAFKVSEAEMKYAIPSEIRVVDTDANGFADRMYFADMGGNLWRVDIDEDGDIDDASTLQPYRLATLGGSGANGNRRFYYPPAVAWIHHNQQKKLAIAIGSGYRAHPLNSTISDRMYVIFDENAVTGAPDSTPDVLSESDFLDVTDNLIQEGDTIEARTTALDALNAASGWYIRLDSGEKSLSSPVIFENKLLFTTFSQGESVLCGLNGTQNRYYLINLVDGTPVETLRNPERNNHNRSTILQDQVHAIAPKPQVIYYDRKIDPEDEDKGNQGCASFMSGLSSTGESCADPNKIYWRETD